ncbi:PREDICTED: uncharacterized protein LOC107117629 [Gekko japonicus]|uniref:Uncharacterized protein LOC107117629 n=1 Tax=Gekko japonicus TaxID=146911 RepID=A0ABM1KNH8_GEKJA|nr:PREDICTED: uncharacterized protein LOC107117629 [Gekko japonicus]
MGVAAAVFSAEEEASERGRQGESLHVGLPGEDGSRACLGEASGPSKRQAAPPSHRSSPCAASLGQELLQLMGSSRRLTRPMLHLLLVPHLTELSLRTCPHLVSTAIAQIISVRCKSLSSLDLHGCSRIPSAILVDLLEGLPSLTKLSLSETQSDTRVLSAVGSTCRRLRELAVSNCKRLSAASLLHLAYDPCAGSFCCPRLQALWAEGLEPPTGSQVLVRALAFLLLALPGLRSLGHRLASEAVALIHAQQFDGAQLAPGFPSLEELVGGRGPAHVAQEPCRATLPLKCLAEVREPLLPAVAATCPDLEEVVVVLLDDSPRLGHGFRSWKTLTRLTLDCEENTSLGELVREMAGLGAQLHSLSLGGFSLEEEATFHALLSCCPALRTFSASLTPPVAWGAEGRQPAGEALQGAASLRPLELPQLRAFSLLLAPCDSSSPPPKAVVMQASLVSLLRGSPRLETLAVVCLPFSLDEVFAGVLEPPGAALRHLQRLSLSQSDISPSTIHRLLASDNQLSHIGLEGCPGIHRRHHSELLRVVSQQGLDVDITWD